MIDDKHLALPVGTTLDRFIKRKQDDFSFATGELSQLLRDIALAGKIINREISRSGLLGIEGAFGATNVQGEEQQKLDVIANIRFKRALKNGGEVCAIISEEEEEIIEVNKDSRYVVAMDPLDGSSNIDVNVSIGTIFSIYRRVSPVGSDITKEDVLQKGSKQIAAGYLLYGSSTMLVYTTGRGVNGFTYEPSLGEFFLSHQNITIPPGGNTFSINEGTSGSFSQGLHDYLNFCKENQYSGRYIGSLVADVHRNLFKGGIFIYPSTAKSPKGKLRLMYECNALAYVIEQAGGLAYNGKIRILDVEPEEMHERVPFYAGNREMVEKAMGYLSADVKVK
jgi:fructose-1,6-bisphosphatase I